MVELIPCRLEEVQMDTPGLNNSFTNDRKMYEYYERIRVSG